ncbi:TIM22 inner membrane protein import complex anchor subunit Tim18 [Schizosaccharomyces japonicus yFS275]|uniref:Succinate dehydrogenase [ubiquinone] cytochrome b small subunit n=1 Tax=Schizosaccharomyces japonicus (strain yFS275 / FY16936) TaxID=402676 RepID=B6K2D0_SCHJY|nr:TIM22 inner membrane protein import complex anchor subunit Tim18 [Schizosaccharomyces japonicus yFS275]EEB07311.1 TIM22 inner membrane protein import complex anchor subunit Tim18 [Schizosaccharomyces japonicus yFS275]
MLLNRIGLFSCKQSRIINLVKPITNIRPFTVTSISRIFPPPPQTIQGTVNDAVVFPPRSKAHGSIHWNFERVIAIMVAPQVAYALASGSSNAVLNALLACTLVPHAHLGFESCIIDYFPKRRFKVMFPLLMWVLRGFTILTFFGLYEFNSNDIGLCQAIRMIWKS